MIPSVAIYQRRKEMALEIIEDRQCSSVAMQMIAREYKYYFFLKILFSKFFTNPYTEFYFQGF